MIFLAHIEKIFHAKILFVIKCIFHVFASAYFRFTEEGNYGGIFPTSICCQAPEVSMGKMFMDSRDFDTTYPPKTLR